MCSKATPTVIFSTNSKHCCNVVKPHAQRLALLQGVGQVGITKAFNVVQLLAKELSTDQNTMCNGKDVLHSLRLANS